jgi:hypothetical protein
VSFSHLSARPSAVCDFFLRSFAGFDEGASGEGAHYDADSVLDHRAFLSVERVAHMTDSQWNTEPLYASCARTPTSRLTVWRCHNVLRQHAFPRALGTPPRSLAKEYRLAEAENSITDFFARRVRTDELCMKADREQ